MPLQDWNSDVEYELDSVLRAFDPVDDRPFNFLEIPFEESEQSLCIPSSVYSIEDDCQLGLDFLPQFLAPEVRKSPRLRERPSFTSSSSSGLEAEHSIYSDTNTSTSSSSPSTTFPVPPGSSKDSVAKVLKVPKRRSSGRPRKARKKTPHEIIEKRYRRKLGTCIDELRAAVPTVRDRGANMYRDDLAQGLETTHKKNKATVYAKAVEYIAHLERLCREVGIESRR